MLLDSLIRYLIIILDDPTTENFQLNDAGETLAESTNILVLGYPFYGLAPDLTDNEMETGIEYANDIVEILNSEQNEISLDLDAQMKLRETAESIIVELLNGQ